MRLKQAFVAQVMIVAFAVGMAIAQAPQGGPGGPGGRGPGGPGGGPGGAGGFGGPRQGGPGGPGGGPGGARQGGPGGPGGARQGGGARGGRGAAFNVTSPSFPDGAEIPVKFSFYGENVSPQFDFKWFNGMTPAEQPATVQSFAVIFRDMENSTNRGTADTLHWSVYNIPGTAKGLPEGLKAGPQPDGTMPGPGIRGGANGSYFGPGAPAGPHHHYMFEFFALDTKLELPPTATREQLLAAMEGHVVGKAVYGGRFRNAQ